MQSLEKPGDRMEKEFEKQGIKLVSIKFIDEETFIYITEEIRKKENKLKPSLKFQLFF